MDVLTKPLATDSAAAMRFRFFWRIHFWAAVITAPIVLFASVTGLLYVFTPQIEAWRHAHLDTVLVSGVPKNLDAQVAAARAANPALSLRTIIPAYEATQTTLVIFGSGKPVKSGRIEGANTAVAAAVPASIVDAGEIGSDEHAAHRAAGDAKPPSKQTGAHQTSVADSPATSSVAAAGGHGFPDGKIAYINPYTGAVLGTYDEMDRFNNWARKLHSTALQGDGWRWVLELGASWLLVMLCTGFYLWWPKSKAAGGRGLSALWPRSKKGLSARLAWREWHSFIGLIAGGMLLIVLVTGLTWSKYTGANFREALKAAGQSAPRAPAKLVSVSVSAAANAPLTTGSIYALASAAAPTVRLQLTPPKDASDVWRVANYDRSQPTARVQLILDQYTGNTLFQAGWDVLLFGAKATGAGIPFHRGEFGLWNQALLIFAALAAIFSVVSGFAMWWQRRPAKAIGAPKISWQHVRAMPLWLWPLATVLGLVMPVFGLSLLAFVGLEILRLLMIRTEGTAV